MRLSEYIFPPSERVLYRGPLVRVAQGTAPSLESAPWPGESGVLRLVIPRSGALTVESPAWDGRQVTIDSTCALLTSGERLSVHRPVARDTRSIVIALDERALADLAPRRLHAKIANAAAEGTTLEITPRLLLGFQSLRCLALRQACVGTERDATCIQTQTLMLVRELLVDVERGPTRRRSIALPHERLARAVQITLASSPGEAHSLAALATRIGASPFHLSHVFRSAMGVSVHRYLVRLRLAAALERLARGDSSISALALDLGFSTHSHFTAAFRRAFGATPREVRAILAGESSGSSAPRAQRAPAASRHAPAGSVAVPTLRLERSSPRPLGTAAWSRPTRTEAEPPDALQLGA